MPTRTSVTTEVETLVGGAAKEKGVKPIAAYVDLALRDLNRFSPRRVRTTLVGDGTDEYVFGEDWDVGFSTIDRVRWVPDNDFNAPPQWFEPDQFVVEFVRATVTTEVVGTGDGSTTTFALDELYATEPGAAVTVNAVAVAASTYTIRGDADGSAITFATAPTNGHAIVATYFTVTPQIRFSLSPSTSDRVVIEHTARHELSETAATTSLNDDEAGALAHKAAALLLRAASAETAGTVPQGTDTDTLVSSYGTAGDAYRRLADDHDALFAQALGLAPADIERGVVTSGPVFVSVPATPNRRNSRYLTHPRRSAGPFGSW